MLRVRPEEVVRTFSVERIEKLVCDIRIKRRPDRRHAGIRNRTRRKARMDIRIKRRIDLGGKWPAGSGDRIVDRCVDLKKREITGVIKAIVDDGCNTRSFFLRACLALD